MMKKKVELRKVDVSKAMKLRIRREVFERSLREDRHVTYKEVVEDALRGYYNWGK